jgi:hypothetical protein
MKECVGFRAPVNRFAEHRFGFLWRLISHIDLGASVRTAVRRCVPQTTHRC